MTEPPLSSSAMAELRHELRTPINIITGYCEMLLEDAAGVAMAPRRAALEEALAAVREALALIAHALPATGVAVGRADVERLYAALREMHDRIVGPLENLLPALGPGDDALRDDLEKMIRAAAALRTGHRRPSGVPTPQTPIPAAARRETGHVGTAKHPARVLVVDDVPDNRMVLERRLTRQGHSVDAAENGLVALEMVGATAYDLILLDVMMPELDGYEVLRRLKAAPATRHIPVLMISALDDLASIAHCIEAGAEDYLPKPFDPVLLRARVGASLEKKRLRDAELRYMDHVGRVIAAAEALEAGRYASGTLGDVAVRDDELGRLARLFDRMATEVGARESKLQGQIDALRAEMGGGARGAPIVSTEAPTVLAVPTAAADARTVTTAPARPRPSAPGELAPGTLVADRFEIVRPLGSGGMGVVYRARDRELDEDVAIKMLHPAQVFHESAIERFKSEIRMARQITSPHVVRTHDFGEWKGLYYLTMEYVEGITVRELISRRGTLTASSTLAIAAQMADALDAAHRQTVIHRDIKPENLLLDLEGVLKVMDFGVARMTQRKSRMTEAGAVVGTPAYMSPEQLLGDDLDARTDFYSTGAVLYECLTGRRPFEADNMFELMADVIEHEPPAPATLNPKIPPALSTLVLRLLAKRRDDRPASAAELRDHIAAVA